MSGAFLPHTIPGICLPLVVFDTAAGAASVRAACIASLFSFTSVAEIIAVATTDANIRARDFRVLFSKIVNQYYQNESDQNIIRGWTKGVRNYAQLWYDIDYFSNVILLKNRIIELRY